MKNINLQEDFMHQNVGVPTEKEPSSFLVAAAWVGIVLVIFGAFLILPGKYESNLQANQVENIQTK